MWQEQQKLLPSQSGKRRYFGDDVALSGDTALIAGARMMYDSDGGPLEIEPVFGDVFVFTRSGGTWTEHQRLLPVEGAPDPDFGSAIALSGDTAIVAGYASAYVFTRSCGRWMQQQELLPSDGQTETFGSSVALNEDTAMVGATWDSDRGIGAGAVYVFKRFGNTWTQTQKLTASDARPSDIFGYPLALDRDTAIIGGWSPGCCGAGPQGSGSAYLFTRSDPGDDGGNEWVEQSKLVSIQGDATSGAGIRKIALSGNTAILQSSSGGALMFTRSADTWINQQVITLTNDISDVALSGDTAVFGAMYDDEYGLSSGSAFVFTRVGGTWTEQQRLVPRDGEQYDLFGNAVAVDGDTVLIGARDDDDNGAYSGSAYAFSLEAADGSPGSIGDGSVNTSAGTHCDTDNGDTDSGDTDSGDAGGGPVCLSGECNIPVEGGCDGTCVDASASADADSNGVQANSVSAGCGCRAVGTRNEPIPWLVLSLASLGLRVRRRPLATTKG
jgi:hypothetical protein